MASIRKRGNRYHVQVRKNGFAPRTKSFLQLSDAKEWARQIELQADRHELPPSQKILKSTLLADLVTRYRDEVVPRKRGAEVETIILNRFLRHSICRKRLSEISTADFATYRDERLAEITAKSLKRQLSPIQNMFRHARIEWGMPLRENPLDALRVAFTDNRRERRLMAGEYERLMSACNVARNPYIKLVIRFATETALRRGEILSLRWTDYDPRRATVTVRETKNGFTRIIPLSDEAQAILQQANRDAEHIFPISAMSVKMCWRRITARAKLDDLHFHDLRHEAISRLFEYGLTVPEVASISGHREVRMLLRYAHASQEAIRAKLARSNH